MKDGALQVDAVRRRCVLSGQVQGVGFRPFVYRLARERRLMGFVRNNGIGVVIEAQGPAVEVEEFLRDIRHKAPKLAAIRSVSVEDRPLADLETDFRIAGSQNGDGHGGWLTPDVALCDACLSELMTAGDRRHGYGLINCTDCGPRYSIVQRVPYDRPNTTMAAFEMCAKCREEYQTPDDRRFHAQPTACPTCGPRITFATPDGMIVQGDPYALAAEKLIRGEIIAIKGLGGYHLAVRADHEGGVARLRALKHRDAKPLALMCRSLEDANRLVELSSRAVRLMQSPACPIVLAPRTSGAVIAHTVAPGNYRVGVMIPYTPIQHLLFAAMGPKATPLVMTSANVGNEPLVYDDGDAVTRLGKLCDGILWHERPIARGVDDSVVIDMGAQRHTIMVRRARGFVPSPIKLRMHDARAGLAVGGELKTTVAVVRDGHAILSQHLGDLSHPRTYHVFSQTINDLLNLFDVKPAWVARDMHPSYLSTAHATNLARDWGVPTVAVQHHHAHAASVMTENGFSGPALAVVCDGTGYGPDGTVWGGELLAADLVNFRRLVRLRPIRLAGGDAAAKDPRRCALGVLHQVLGGDLQQHPMVAALFPREQESAMLMKMVLGGISCVESSSAGRLFDAASALLGICIEQNFEAQAAMALEAAAWSHSPDGDARRLFILREGRLGEIDLSPLFLELLEKKARGAEAGALAALFHEQFCRAWCAAVLEAVEQSRLTCVVLSGGVFCNAIITSRLVALLEENGLHVLRHRMIPPTDGGLALGQAAVAAARAARGRLGKDGV